MSFRIETAIELLEQAHRNARLAHAYLITGPAGAGKEKLAIRMIEMVNEAARTKQARALDELKNSTTTVIAPESRSRRITVEAIRTAEHTLQMAAPDGVTKFLVVRDADRMGVEAENAFLKTLEEPPSASRLLLLTARPEMLLDTILSRCITLALKGPDGPADVPERAGEFLEKLRDYTESGERSLSAAMGLVAGFTTVLKEEKEEITKRNEAAFKQEVATYKQTTEGDYLKRREEYYKALTQAEYLEQRNRLVEFLVMWLGDALRQQHGAPQLDLPAFAEATRKLAGDSDTPDLCRRIDAVEKLRSNLQTNVAEALALEAAFIRAFA